VDEMNRSALPSLASESLVDRADLKKFSNSRYLDIDMYQESGRKRT
jgi:hypothetical protein